MNRSSTKNLAFAVALALAFAAGRYTPTNQVNAAEALPVELVHDGSLLWATAIDPARPIVVFGWSTSAWAEKPKDAPSFLLPKQGQAEVPVPVAAGAVDRALVYELKPVALWTLEFGTRPCYPGVIECEWIPLPPLPPRPPKMLTLGIVPG